MSATLQVKQIVQVPRLSPIEKDDTGKVTGGGKPIISEKTGPVTDPGVEWHDVGVISAIDGNFYHVALTSAAAMRLMPDMLLENRTKHGFDVGRSGVESSADLRIEGDITTPKASNARTLAAPEAKADADDVEVPADSDVEVEAPPYEEWSKAELKAECAARELSKSGSKDDLVSRLDEDDAVDDGADE